MAFIVCKFGGSSVATKEKIEQVKNIIDLSQKRRCIILSAPGKASGINTKVTDSLLNIITKSLEGKDISEDILAVKRRYTDIYTPLGLSKKIITKILNTINNRINSDTTDPKRFRDAMAALGEELNSRLFAEYLKICGKKAIYISPEEIGLYVTDTYGDAQPLAESRQNLKNLKEICKKHIVIFPGFYGITKSNNIATFSRGGSDLTGALCAEAIDAQEYENWTDVDGIFSANPNYVTNPEQIPALTYREMRELSYMGFNVFHEEAVRPVTDKKIPIRLRNTNNLDNTGTLIVAKRLPSERDVIGIAGGGKYCSFNVSKFLMNRELGFGRKLLAIFEQMGLSYEHSPSGVDNISVLIDQDQLRPETVNTIIRKIEETLNPDDIKTEFGIALIAIVGEGLLHKIGVLGQVANALANANVNIKIVNQGSSEISIIFGIDATDERKAVDTLYKELFN